MDYEAITHHTGTVLVEFYASWCPHCQRMMPVVEQVKQLLGEQVPVYQFDIDKEPKASDEAGVQSVPTFIVYRNGREMWRQAARWRRQHLSAQQKNIFQKTADYTQSDFRIVPKEI